METSTRSSWLALTVAAALSAALVGCERQDAASVDNARSSSDATMNRGSATAPMGRDATVAGSREGRPASSPQGPMGAGPSTAASGEKPSPVEVPSGSKTPGADAGASRQKDAS
jgi:hypothetical protein